MQHGEKVHAGDDENIADGQVCCFSPEVPGQEKGAEEGKCVDHEIGEEDVPSPELHENPCPQKGDDMPEEEGEEARFEEGSPQGQQVQEEQDGRNESPDGRNGHGVHPEAEKQEKGGEEKVQHRQEMISHQHVGPACGEKPDRCDDAEETEGGQFSFESVSPVNGAVCHCSLPDFVDCLRQGLYPP